MSISNQPISLIRRKQLEQRMGIGRSTIYLRINQSLITHLLVLALIPSVGHCMKLTQSLRLVLQANLMMKSVCWFLN